MFDDLTGANRSHMQRLLTKRINLCLHLPFARLSQLAQRPQSQQSWVGLFISAIWTREWLLKTVFPIQSTLQNDEPTIESIITLELKCQVSNVYIKRKIKNIPTWNLKHQFCSAECQIFVKKFQPPSCQGKHSFSRPKFQKSKKKINMFQVSYLYEACIL